MTIQMIYIVNSHIILLQILNLEGLHWKKLE